MFYAEDNLDAREKELMFEQVSQEERRHEKVKRKEKYSKKYLSQIIKEEKPKFANNNLILAPVGSGKSHLIENMLIPDNYDKKIIYLTSNTALKDSVCPNDNETRNVLSDKGVSLGFFTSGNKEKIGNVPYSVHVMTYSEFGERIHHPSEEVVEDVEIIFCDEIHSLPKYFEYDNSYKLGMALNWLLKRHENIKIFYFTATEDSIVNLEEKRPGYFDNVVTFNYLNHPQIRKYVSNSTYYITHIAQLREHLRAKKESFDYYGYKSLAFTRLISEQKKIEEIAKEEGFKPIVLWSINNTEFKMSEEQLNVRKAILNTGLIPEPYNLLIINGAMQEGWNLYDDKVTLAILDTVDITEQVQALGRIRKDIDLVIKRTKDESLIVKEIKVPESYLNKYLTTSDKNDLCEELNIINDRGTLKRWVSIKGILKELGYKIEEESIRVDGKQMRVSTIIAPEEN